MTEFLELEMRQVCLIFVESEKENINAGTENRPRIDDNVLHVNIKNMKYFIKMLYLIAKISTESFYLNKFTSVFS